MSKAKLLAEEKAFDEWYKAYKKITISTLFRHNDTVEIAREAFQAGVDWCDEQERV